MKMRNFVKKSKRGQGHVIEVVLLIVVVLLVCIGGFRAIGDSTNEKTSEIVEWMDSDAGTDEG